MYYIWVDEYEGSMPKEFDCHCKDVPEAIRELLHLETLNCRVAFVVSANNKDVGKQLASDLNAIGRTNLVFSYAESQPSALRKLKSRIASRFGRLRQFFQDIKLKRSYRK